MLKSTDKTYHDINTKKYLSQSSFLSLFPLLKDNDGQYVYNIFRPYILNEDIFVDKNFDVTTVMYNEWWENISYDYYGSVDQWWVVCLTNGVVNPFEELNPAQTLYELKEQYLPILYTDMEKVKSL